MSMWIVRPRYALVLGLGVLGLVWLGLRAFSSFVYLSQPDPERQGIPVVVELFTSQGCASCPPADRLLIALEEEQPVPGVLVIPLSFHIDYWNRVWTDPFSSPAFSERQRTYHPLLRDRARFTPEMVVNGHMQFVGSQRMLAVHAVEHAAAMPMVVLRVDVTERPGSGSVQVTIMLDGGATHTVTEDADVWLAVTETGLETSVLRGENATRTLRHTGVVRSLTDVASLHPPVGNELSATVDVELDPRWRRENLHAVAFLQERQSRHIRGAAQRFLLD